MWNALAAGLIVLAPLLGAVAGEPPPMEHRPNGFSFCTVIVKHCRSPCSGTAESGKPSRKNYREPIAIDVEYLDALRLEDATLQRVWVDLLRGKYEHSQPDLVIPVHDVSASLFVSHYQELFPDAAVVFCSLSEQMHSQLPLTARKLLEIVEDGRALVEAALRLRPDVIVADITMPQLNGLDAVEQIRRSGCDAKVIFLTMHKDAVYAARAQRVRRQWIRPETLGEHRIVDGPSHGARRPDLCDARDRGIARASAGNACARNGRTGPADASAARSPPVVCRGIFSQGCRQDPAHLFSDCGKPQGPDHGCPERQLDRRPGPLGHPPRSDRTHLNPSTRWGNNHEIHEIHERGGKRDD
jgi:CheY-like chemotaxis protein